MYLTYSSLSNGALAELIEVNEEFLNADSILGDTSLNALLDIVFVAQNGGLPLVIALMAMSGRAHVLYVIAD